MRLLPTSACLLCCLLFGCSGSVGSRPDAGDRDGTSDGRDGSTGDDGGGDDGADVPACIDLDNDGQCREVDCDDLDPHVGPAAAEACGNGLDDDCDGETDEGCTTGADLYVDKDSIGGPCADDGAGTKTAPWCTIGKANASVQAGQTVLIRAGIYSEPIRPTSSGSSDALRITFSNEAGERVTIQEAQYGIRLEARSYITVTGIEFFNCARNVYLSGSSHNIISACEFDTPVGPATWAGSRLYDGSTYNRILGNTFSRYGNETYYDDSYQDNGCILDIGNDNQVDPSDHNLVAGNNFFYGGHHILGVYSSFNVVRDNTFHNEEWYECHRPEIGGLCGNRDVILNTSDAETNQRNVLEDNYIVFAGVPPDQVSSAGLSVRTQLNIIRRNIFYFCDSSGLALSADGGGTNDASNNYIYNNVFYKNGYLLLDDWDPRKNGLMLARWVDDAEHKPMTGVAIKNNIFHENQLHAIYYYYVDPAEQVVDLNWEEQGDPGFADTSGQPDPFDFQVFDFHLRPDSPCVDAGGFLTRATNSGAGSTALLVEEAGYFSDGLGLVAGDIIQLEGQAATAMVSRVDYSTNAITLDRPLSWEPGTGVSLAYFGDGPDQGAFEQ